MFAKNDIITAEVTALGSAGEGIARIDNFVIFIKGALPGEQVRARILSVKKGYAFARVEEIQTRSPQRVSPRCAVFGKCGGCALQHLDYPAQLEFKRRVVLDALTKIAKINIPVELCVSSPEQYGYRNKCQVPVATGKKGELTAGFYRAASNDIVPIRDCPLHGNWFGIILRETLKFCGENGIGARGSDSEKPLLRHIAARASSDCVIITLVALRAALPQLKTLYDKLKDALGCKVGIYLNINSSNGNVIFGKKFVHIAGEKLSRLNTCGIKTGVHPAAFAQVNSGVTDALYGNVIAAAATFKPSVIIDAYSGSGLLTALVAPLAGQVLGIEIEPEATVCADRLMRDNCISNVTNITGDCAEVLPRILQEYPSATVILDPPRKGCAPEVLVALKNSDAANIIYVSCNPATLARDVAALAPEFSPISAVPHDMFPQTPNVETILTLTRSAK